MSEKDSDTVTMEVILTPGMKTTLISGPAEVVNAVLADREAARSGGVVAAPVVVAPAPVVDPVKVAAAFVIVEKTAAQLEKAKSVHQLALKQLKDLSGSATCVVDGVYWQIRERTGTGMYMCKLEGPPKGRGKGKKNMAAAEASALGAGESGAGESGESDGKAATPGPGEAGQDSSGPEKA